MSPCPLQAFESTERYWCVAVLFDPPQIDNDAGLAQGRATALYLIVCIKGPLGRIPAWIGEMSPVKVGRVADVPSLPGRIKAALQKEDGDKHAVERKSRYPRCYTLYSTQRCRLPWRIDYSSGESDDLSRSNRTTHGGTLPGTGCAVTNNRRGVATTGLGRGSAFLELEVSLPCQRREFTKLAYSVPVEPSSGRASRDAGPW